MQIGKILKDRGWSNRGFTMIEVIAVLVLIGIIAVVAISRYTSTAEVDLIAKQEILKSHIRYAQSRAMNSNMIWGIQFSGLTYSLFAYSNGTAVTPTPIFPNVDSGSAPMPPGMSATGIVAFDFFGRPYTDVTTTTPYTTQIIAGITITPDTGFVP